MTRTRMRIDGDPGEKLVGCVTLVLIFIVGAVAFAAAVNGAWLLIKWWLL